MRNTCDRLKAMPRYERLIQRVEVVRNADMSVLTILPELETGTQPVTYRIIEKDGQNYDRLEFSDYILHGIDNNNPFSGYVYDYARISEKESFYKKCCYVCLTACFNSGIRKKG